MAEGSLLFQLQIVDSSITLLERLTWQMTYQKRRPTTGTLAMIAETVQAGDDVTLEACANYPNIKSHQSSYQRLVFGECHRDCVPAEYYSTACRAPGTVEKQLITGTSTWLPEHVTCNSA